MTGAIIEKIKRRFMANYIDAAPPSKSKESYVRLGKDPKEYIVEMNVNVGTKNNIWGEMSVALDSYQSQVSVEPYYAEIGEPLFERPQGTVGEQRILDDLKTSVAEAHLWDPVEVIDGTHVACEEDTIIEVSSYGGDTTEYQIPFNVYHSGSRVKGKFVLATRTFTTDI